MSFIPLKPIPLKDRMSMIFVGMGQIDVRDGAFVVIDEVNDLLLRHDAGGTGWEDGETYADIAIRGERALLRHTDDLPESALLIVCSHGGLIGATVTRGWAMASHIPALKGLPDFELAAIATSRRETADAAAKAMESRIRQEAKTIAESYLEPPFTTDFAILFLPSEGLYAEVLRRPGLMEGLQAKHKVTLAGPTTMLALLNSLQMGFRTLAIERQAADVWKVLGAVKTEFERYGEWVAKVRDQVHKAASTLDNAETRSRQMRRALSKVEALPMEQVPGLLPSAEEGEAE